MRFDDRLKTVLDQPASDPHDRAVRWRQLVDLVARAGGQVCNPLVDQALEVIRADRGEVAEHLRAAAARAVAALPLPFELVALFASDKVSVSAPVLAAARLEEQEWQRLLELADGEARNFIATMRPELATADAGAAGRKRPIVTPPAPPPNAEPDHPPSISDVIARIEQLRRTRGEQPDEPPAAVSAPAALPRMPHDRVPALFRWECGPGGDIAWVEGAPRGPLIGRSIARVEEGEGIDSEVERAFAMRAPFRDAPFAMAGEGPLAGQWKLSGVPAFDPADGRFRGYRGIALRDGAPAHGSGPAGLPPHLADPTSLRELVHELKTPLNAIIGFAEIIDGQYLGPAERQYRTRAAEIVAQARLLLAAIDDLDFAAKLQADRERPRSGTDLAVLLEQIATAMQQGTSGDAPRLAISVDTRRRRCALEPALAERLVTRFCTALISAAPDRTLVQLHLDSTPGRCLLWVKQPGRGSRSSESDEFGFGLRLARGLARIAGGDVTVARGKISLTLPEL